ncbi:hypothetical protein [Hamadaea tsunoensis]|uniref:hypothetical protein n=1 Tax=Hamadaea tsunoensis TaxID=53368 RepID=UPI0003F96F36|nr:hypothetical protein [Hamadaea tsunoensis]
MSARRSAVADTLQVVSQAAVSFWRTWPVLLTISFLGVAAHGLILDAAVWASRFGQTLGVLVLAFVPLALLTAIVAMLRAIRPTLPYLTSIDGYLARHSKPHMLEFLGSVAVPFLAVYTWTTEGTMTMKEDVSRYAYEVLQSSDPATLLHNLPLSPTISLGVLVGAAILIRFVLGRFSFFEGRVWASAIGAYVEVLAVGAGLMGLNGIRSSGVDWLGAREISTWWGDLRTRLTVDTPSFVSWAFDHLMAAYSSVQANANTVIIAPILWIALGAVVYGHQLAEARLTDERYMVRATRWVAASKSRLLRTVVTVILSEMHRRWGPLGGGLRLLMRAGLRPMMLFCVMFVVIDYAGAGLWEVERLLIGPQDLGQVWMPVSYFLAPFNFAVQMVLTICLIGAATDRLLSVSGDAPATEPSATSTSATPTSAATGRVNPPAEPQPQLSPA